MPENKLLIAGIRPEYFEDASVVEADKLAKGATFRATIDVVEWLGNEAYAYMPYEAPPEVASQLAELEKELDSEALRTQLIVSLGSASRVKRRRGGRAVRRRPQDAPVRARLRRQPHPPSHRTRPHARARLIASWMQDCVS